MYQSATALSQSAVKSLNVTSLSRLFSDRFVLLRGNRFVVHIEVVSIVEGFFLRGPVTSQRDVRPFLYCEPLPAWLRFVEF